MGNFLSSPAPITPSTAVPCISAWCLGALALEDALMPGAHAEMGMRGLSWKTGWPARTLIAEGMTAIPAANLSIADWGKHRGIRSNQNSSSLELKHYKAWTVFFLGPCRPSQPVENTPNSQMSVGVLSLPGPRVRDLAGRGGSAQSRDNNELILPSWERGWGHTIACTSWSAESLSPSSRQLQPPALCDQSLM